MSETNPKARGCIQQFPQSRMARVLLQPGFSKASADDLADYFERLARLAGNNAVLAFIGKTTIGTQFVGDASGLDKEALRARTELIDCWIEQQQQILDQHMTRAAAARQSGLIESPSIATEY